jgi:hypothetical protein
MNIKVSSEFIWGISLDTNKMFAMEIQT